jgi:predicted hydrolase (HD superfamily)
VNNILSNSEQYILILSRYDLVACTLLKPKEILPVKSAVDSLINKHLPKSFYAGLNNDQRLRMLVEHWQRAIEVNQQLEEKLSKLTRL